MSNRLSRVCGMTAMMLIPLAGLQAAELHVAVTGNDAQHGTKKAPLRTIQRAANLAQPGDIVTVHEGIYRETISPPRGGVSDQKRIVYQAAQGEKVTITGSEIVKGWTKVTNDTWKVTLPNRFFGTFNPYSDLIHGDWFNSHGRMHHTGAVYLNGHWLIEAASHLNEVLAPAGSDPLWFGKVDGATDTDYLLNISAITVGQQRIAADTFTVKNGDLHAAPNGEGGQCMGWIRDGSWLKFDKVNFGNGTENIELRAASVTGGGDVEIRLEKADGELLGRCVVMDTGDWTKWNTFTAKIKPTSGEKAICLVFRSHTSDRDDTTIWAQFKEVNPNEANVEINVRQTVFTPEKTGINYITVRGFDLRNAATPWAPPTAKQIGIVSALWCKGWIIENNEISYSKCSGVALGKYGDEWDNRAESAEGYVGTLNRAMTNGWNKATVGSHIVRNNHIHHCDQTGIVGSLGCSFSSVTGNVIHDIHLTKLFGGAEMAGIKFHGAIDVTISKNHIYRCGDVSGIWLDWMGQGAQVTCNLLHDNTGWAGDLFLEMQHGPLLVANNLFLSKNKIYVNSKGMAFAHNLIASPVEQEREDGRQTPFHKPHSTEVAGLKEANNGDQRFYNNVFVTPANLNGLDNALLPCFAAGNVFTKGTQPSKFDVEASLKPDFDAGLTLTEKPDGWYLTILQDKAWRSDVVRMRVTTELLGKANVPGCAYENVDGTPLSIDSDYFSIKRDEKNPFPGPFEISEGGKQTLKVWGTK